MNRIVLFLCPHGAAKSVLAAAYFNALAVNRGLSWEARSAGTEPDKVVMPTVSEMLYREGIDVTQLVPHQVTVTEMEAADRIISFDCDPGPLPAGKQIVYWRNVPPASQDLLASRKTIYQHVEVLLEELLRSD